MLEGDLTDFTLPDVLRLLAFTTKTGRLTMDDGSRRGRVDLVDGRVRDASGAADQLPLARRVLGTGVVDGDTLVQVLGRFEVLPTDLELARGLVSDGGVDAADLADLVREQTLDAVFDLLRWQDGSFRFTVGADGLRGPSVLDHAIAVDELLEEATRRLEAWPALAARTGQLGAVVSLRRPEGSGTGNRVELPGDGWTLLTLIDGRRTVAELIALSGQGEHRTRRTLGALVDEGVVEVGEPDGPGRLERLLAAHEAIAARERQLGGQPPSAPAVPAAPAPAAAASPPAAPTDELTAQLVVESGTDDPPSEEPEVASEDPVPVAPPSGTQDARSLRTRVRSDRLRTDPTVDEDLVTRLIEGVENL